ncbi:MAG: isoleucine--tRNA ligase [Peptococcaceae bacterium]|nr:isoleucine--tRNA ligase [Peptococcaceae bacterium]
MDYGKTLNLPQTKFPMRANLPQREVEFLKFWDEVDIYSQVQEKNSGRPTFILHDGPPYANGHIHMGHVLNKVLKDIVVKYHSMAGFDSPYVPGWDTHGLPIEQQAIKAFGLNRHEIDLVEFRKKCKDFALKYVDIQREEFKRLGVRGQWDKPYLTLQPHFEARQIGVFGEMAKKGYIYKGMKPVYWCAACETALAEAEVEYADKESASIYVRFPVKDGKGLLPEKDTYLVIWTTTPWTLPANVAICLHPEYQYVLLQVGSEKYLVAAELKDDFLENVGLGQAEVVGQFTGAELEHIECRHPFVDRTSLVILGDHVTLDQGTGCVHTAPGHGIEDFDVGKQYGLPVLSPVNSRGVFGEEGGIFAGQFFLKANDSVLEELEHRGNLMNQSTIMHQYPHCWRCKKPVFFRATEQWFASIDGFRQAALEAIRKVRWIPAWGEERIYNMVEDRGDWCISRQRTWGVPIPIFYCRDCGKELINDQTIKHLQDLFRENGSDVWFAREAEDLLPPGVQCECGCTEFTKEKDIMDVWFDSGTSHYGVLDEPAVWPGLSWPADLYLEGSDQHRGWFNSSLSTAVAVSGQAPYRAVLTHGFVVDEQGRKQSKSLGNVVDPAKVIKQMGADILRLWVSSADYRSDLASSPGILKQLTEAYRKIRNTCRFLLGNLYDFDPATDGVDYKGLLEIDRWALLRLQKLIQKVTAGYRNYEYHVVYHAIHSFCTVDMSSLYLDIIKDRLYTMPAASKERRSAQTVMYEVLSALVRLLAPVLTFTTEEIWRHMPGDKDGLVSVQLAEMPQVVDQYIDIELEEKWDRLLAVRSEVTKVLETARRDKVIGNSLQAAVELYLDRDLHDFLAPLAAELPVLFIVSAVRLASLDEAPTTARANENVPGLLIAVQPATGDKCERCWMYHDEVGADETHQTLCPRCAQVMKQI